MYQNDGFLPEFSVHCIQKCADTGGTLVTLGRIPISTRKKRSYIVHILLCLGEPCLDTVDPSLLYSI